jgi:Ni/Co efflux regulator RcnB
MHIPSVTGSSFLRALGLLLCGVVLVSAAHAAKPEWAGKGKEKQGGEEQRQAQSQEQGGTVEIRIGGYFGDDQRRVAADYYGQEKAKGRCPPGLAKKNNGCLPPGQAKQWSKGQPLPSGLVIYPVPKAVTVKIGLPPAGYKYVRIANDILLIAIGTSIVVDAIEDLMR